MRIFIGSMVSYFSKQTVATSLYQWYYLCDFAKLNWIISTYIFAVGKKSQNYIYLFSLLHGMRRKNIPIGT